MYSRLAPSPYPIFLRTRWWLYTCFTKTNHHVQILMEENIFFPILPIRGEKMLYFFLALAVSRQNFLPITGIKEMICGIAFDRFDRLSSLRALPYDRFKILTIVPIVLIELNSIQASKVVSVARIVCCRSGSVSIRATWKPGFRDGNVFEPL